MTPGEMNQFLQQTARKKWRVIRISHIMRARCTKHSEKVACHALLKIEDGLISLPDLYCGECLLQLFKDTLPQIKQVILTSEEEEPCL